MGIKSYQTPMSFKAALEERLKQAITEGRDLHRQRQLLIFDRFLARLTAEFEDAIVLKGGLVLELRLQKARMTKDVDVRFSGDARELLIRLQRAGRADLRDFMSFQVESDRRHPAIQGEATKYDGQRFKVTCRIAGKIYGSVFGLDVGVGDPILGAPEEITAVDRLAFIGVEPPRLRVYPLESHLAEKLHAYTMPRDVPNSRIKDLPDLALISLIKALRSERVYQALVQTFTHRATHPIPSELPRPPESWHRPYEQNTREFDLQWPTLDACFERAGRFLDPVLAGGLVATWDPERGEWS
ncbi:MAG: nucleotidyl transferase AbiEii/AbiGii toxin family protein [Deltaproteobacteria bacterium]|nr:nucleotidyl transferase AbiEii/AbiGii toxin family protein [Deltaproteobacteria bacterium]